LLATMISLLHTHRIFAARYRGMIYFISPFVRMLYIQYDPHRKGYAAMLVADAMGIMRNKDLQSSF